LIKIRYLSDSYRVVNSYGGYTWGKNNPTYIRSRLDHILVHKNLACKIKTSNVTYEFNESDHQYLSTEICVSELKYGPGILRVNSTLLECPVIKDRVVNDIKLKLDEIPTNWNPHQVLDYFKYSLRIIMLKEGRIKSNHDKNKLELSNIEINRLKTHLDGKLLEFGIDPSPEQSAILESLKDAIDIAELEIIDLKEQEASRLIFKSRAKWAEEGEKSNKYFLNLLKERQKRMQIRKIVSNGSSFYRQDEISKAINMFYKNLYKKQNVDPVDIENSMFKNLPKLDEADKTNLESPLTLDELYLTLGTCGESAPGPDGITYDTYKHLWPIAGPIIINSWQYSCKAGRTSDSQRQAVISLLEKKGKDRTIIENLRPISLSNCDIKLCTKAIALRTNKILNKLIHITQAGYVPGRQVTDNIRLLEEMMDRANDIKEKAYLVTLDAQKAFDSVDHNYLLKILEIYGFPSTYINWVKLLYKDLQATVLVNGYTSEWFRIEQSVKQGDALSCALFLLAIEPLISSIRHNKDITPIKIASNFNENSIEVNEATFADDITALTTSREGIQAIINEYNNFTKFSGVKLNVPKTEIMILGKNYNEANRECFDITSSGKVIKILEQDSVKICGICFSSNKDIAYKENILNKITKLERQLDIWRSRNLTLEGKILIVKTFGLSQLIYSLQSTNILNEDLDRIDRIIFRFIWSIKKTSNCNSGKIARDILRSNYENGGLKAPSVFNINESIKYKTLLRHINNDIHPVSLLYKNRLNNLGFQWSAYTANLNDNSFIGYAAKIHIRLGKLLHNDIKTMANQEDGIHKNYYSFVQNMSLIHNPFTNIHQKPLINRLLVYNINNLISLHQEKQVNRFPNLFLEKYQIYNSFPIEWRKLLSQTNRIHANVIDEIPIGLNKWQHLSKISLKDISIRISMEKVLISPNDIITKRHKENLYTNEYSNPFTVTRMGQKDIRLRNIQFKILHNIYPTMKHLFTWKIKETPNCSLCLVPETLKHAIFECPVAKRVWENLKEILNLDYVFVYSDILMGLSTTNSIRFGKRKSYSFDTLLILLKQKLILQRENKIHIDRDQIVNLIFSRIKIEKYNSMRYKRERHFETKWKWIENIVSL